MGLSAGAGPAGREAADGGAPYGTAGSDAVPGPVGSAGGGRQTRSVQPRGVPPDAAVRLRTQVRRAAVRGSQLRSVGGVFRTIRFTAARAPALCTRGALPPGAGSGEGAGSPLGDGGRGPGRPARPAQLVQPGAPGLAFAARSQLPVPRPVGRAPIPRRRTGLRPALGPYYTTLPWAYRTHTPADAGLAEEVFLRARGRCLAAARGAGP